MRRTQWTDIALWLSGGLDVTTANSPVSFKVDMITHAWRKEPLDD